MQSANSEYGHHTWSCVTSLSLFPLSFGLFKYILFLLLITFSYTTNSFFPVPGKNVQCFYNFCDDKNYCKCFAMFYIVCNCIIYVFILI